MFAFRRDRKRTLRFRAARRVVAAAAALALVFLSLLPAAPARAAVAEELASHVVPGLDPENTVVNLFDYDMGRLDESTGDLNRPLLETDEASVYEWWFGGKEGKNINSGRLLTFGTGMKSFMGYWNQGSGSSQGLFSYNNPGFPFMVAPTLSEGQPSLSDRTDPAGSVLVGYNGNPSVYKDAQRGEAGDGDRIFASAGARNVATGVQYLADHLGKYGDAAKVQQGNGSFEGGSLSDDLLSLGYLFDGSDQPGKTRYENVTGLFQLDEEGYYYYNMRRNFAEFTEDATEGSAGHFTLYDAPAVNGTNSVGGFFPFDPATEVFRVADGKLENAVAADNSKEHNLNHHLGMTVETVFRQPSGGTIGDNGAPMTFQFSGDDDVWVFIDDVLVLDLGGIHSELFGTIDFATGEVLLGPSYGTKGIPEDPADFAVRKTTIRRMFEYAQDPDGASDPYASRSYTHSTDNGYVIEDGTWQGDAPARTDTATVGGVRFNGETFASDTGHSLKMFYLERGNYDSSLSLRFNLQPELFQEVVKVDQYGNPLAGAEFDLYAARPPDSSVPTPETAPSYADSAELRLSSAPVASGVTTGDDGVARFVEGNGDPLNFADRYNQATGDGLLYVLRETRAPAGYKSLPQDIVLSYNPATSQFRVNNRYQTGAYAGFNVLVTGSRGGIFYGDFAEDGGLVSKPDGATPIDTDTQRGGLVLAVPMLRRADAWLPLYGDNLNGFDAVEYERSDDYGERLVQVRRATLAGALRQAALYARDSGAQPWYLGWDEATGRIAGTLYDLPGRSDRYLQVNAQGDMRMLYGFIDAEAIAEVTGLGPEAVGAMAPEERYLALGQAVQGDDVDGLLDRLDLAAPEAVSRGYSAVDIRDFVRNYRSVINVPNEVRQLRVMKVDQKGAPVNGATFSLYDNAACEGAPVAAGTTATVDGVDGMLVFGPGEAQEDGHGRMVWPDTPATSDNSSMATYYLKETGVPEGYEANDTVIPVKVGVYSIYADAGDADDGVTVMAGVGKLTQTMVKYTKGDVNITLRRILAAGQTKPSGGWDGDWTAMELPDSGDPAQPRIMRLVYGQNALVDYGLSDEDGGRTVRPFFVTDTGYVRAAVSQDTQALRTESGASGVNFDDIEGRDITGLFSLLNVVVVTDREVDPEKTGTLEVSKTVEGDGLTSEDYLRSFSFTFEFTDGEGRPLDGDRSYHFIGRDEWGSLKSGDTIPLHHGETIEVRGLPAGTRYRVTETVPDGSGFYTKTPYDAVHEGVVEIGEDDPDGKVFSAPFVNAKGVATLRLVKTDGATSAPLAGVTFELYALGEGGEAVGDALERATTAEDGSVTLTHGFPETGSARFALREVAAPDGYAAPAAPIVLACDDGVLSVANPRESGAQMGDAVGGAPVVEVANVPTATLSLSKEVLPAEGGSGLTDDQRNQAFTFDVAVTVPEACALPERLAVSVASDGGEPEETEVAVAADSTDPARGTFGLGLSHGQTATVSGLPVGTEVEVTEGDAPGYQAVDKVLEGVVESDGCALGFTNTAVWPDLSIEKSQSATGDPDSFTDGPIAVVEGQTVTYRLTVTNGGDDAARGVTVTDAVPQAPVEPAGADGPALAYVDGSARVVDGAGEASYDDGTKTVTWVLGDVPAGESRTVEFQVTVPWVGEATEWENVGVARYANNPHGPDAELPTDPVRVGTDLGTGALGVSKTVTAADGSEPTDDQRGARFHFTVRLAHPRVPLPAQVTVDYGDGGAPVGSETVTLANYTQLGGMLTVSLSHGQTATVQGLPDGTFYTVTEEPAEGFEAERDKASGAVGLAGAQAAFVNRALPPDEPDPVLGSLSIAKTVAGAATDDDRARAFTFSLSLLDGEGRPLAGSFPATMADGSASEVSHGSTFALAHGQRVTVGGLPQGTRYAVTEEETEGFEAVSVGQEGVVPGDAEASATFVNVRKPQDPEPGPGPEPEEPVGDVAVSKTVDPAGAQDGDFERAFTFVLSLTDGDGAPLGGTVDAELLDGADVSSLTLGDGGRFELRHGQVLLIHGLPVGTRYAVAEEPSDGFTAAEPTLEGVVEEGSSTGSLAFVNRRVAPPALKVEKTQAPVAADGTASGLTSDGLQVPEGATVEYRLTVTNTGEAAAEDVEVSDEVPATATKTSPGTSAPAGTVDLPLTYVDGSASDGGVFRPADADGAARVTWRLGTLAGGESRTVSFRVALPVPDAPVTPEDSGAVWSWRNVAVARFANNPDNPADPSDPPADIPSNPVDVEEGEPRPLVEIHKHQHVKGSDAGFGQEGADSPLPVEPGDTVVYRLRVVNNGAGAAPDVVVRDPLPDGLAYVEGSASHGGVYDGGARTLVWHLGELASRGTVELTFEVEVPTVAEATVWHNVAVADHGTPDDPSSRVEVPPSEDVFVATDVAHLALRKEQSLAGGAFTADPVEGRGGDLLTYRLAVTNDGAAVARGVTVTDMVPQTPVEPSGSQGPALGYVEGSAGIAGSPEAGSFDVETGTVSWDVGDLRPGQTVFVHFSVRLPEVAAGAKVTWENVGVARFENDPAGPGTDIPSNGVEVTVEGDPDPVTPPDEPAPATGSIAVSKTVEGGDEGHRQTAFVFELVLTDAQGEPLAGDFGWERSDGASGTVASGDTLELSHGQIAVVGGLPEGTRWTLTEREAEGFSAREPSLGGEVPAGGVATAVFVNVVDEDPGEPDDPNGPDDPGGPEGPGDPGEPEDPGKPDDPEGPDDPNGPEDPEGPDDPAAPDDPGAPGAPDGPTGTPDGPGPGASRPTAGAGGRSTGAARIASTGDVGAPVLGLALAAAVVAAGLVRAVRR